jgi:DNA polymerase-3 subunit gamma/tau
MAYQSLYRKYRPQRFGELVAQDHVTTALRNAVRDGRVGHAYLFSGPRGTGKTTTARILAKALNCLDLTPDGDACGVCDNCVGIAAGRFLDLFELDAASHNGVEDIRDLNESVHLGLGITATTKVYLIDEVHMLSAAASNALLKTLEEPPEHVVFVLATTGPERVLPTIRSRTQHFEFTLYTVDELAGHLADVCEREGVPADPAALDVIARAAAGSMRDALSLLEQAMAHGTLDIDAVSALFGGTGFELRMALLDALATEDVPGVIVGLGELLDAGHDPRRITEDLLVTARDTFLLTSAKGRVRVDAPEDQVARLAALGEQLGQPYLVRVLETLGQAVVDMRGTDAADPRLVLEIALVRLARREAGPPLQVLQERVERLERAAATGGADRAAPAAPGASDAVGSRPAGEPGPRRRSVGALRAEKAAAAAATGTDDAPADPPPPSATVPDAAPADPDATAPVVAAPVEVDLDDVIVAWAGILSTLGPATKAAAQDAQPLRVDDGVIILGVAPRSMANARERLPREADNIRAALRERLGVTLQFKLEQHDGFEGNEVPEARAPRAATPASTPLDEPPVGEAPLDDVDEDIDLGDLVDAPAGDAAFDSVSKFAASFDATVVEERPRD